jgi:hypothetical protein
MTPDMHAFESKSKAVAAPTRDVVEHNAVFHSELERNSRGGLVEVLNHHKSSLSSRLETSSSLPGTPADRP